MPNTPLQPNRDTAPLALRTTSRAIPAPPLIRLRRSGAGHVWLKHEGYSAGGSVFDRVATHLLGNHATGPLLVVGADAFSYSLAVHAAAAGRSLTVYDVRPNERRLRTLLRGVGATIKSFKTSEAMWQAVDAFAGTRLLRDDEQAVCSSLAEVAAEVRAEFAGEPAHWVLPDFGLPQAVLAKALAVTETHVSTVADDGERRRTLEGSAGARRQQVAHREGILLSPIGAELVEQAVCVADDVDGEVVVLVPECGRRFVGWW